VSLGSEGALFLGYCVSFKSAGTISSDNALNQPQPLEARMALPADDDVVMDRDPKRFGDLDDVPGQILICFRISHLDVNRMYDVSLHRNGLWLLL
jgi:hypothetical protein